MVEIFSWVNSYSLFYLFDCTNLILDEYRIYLKVLGNGEVLEFDSPYALLSYSNSHFTSLVDQIGSAEAEHLRSLAKI